MFERILMAKTFPASADLSTKQYYWVQLDSSGQVEVSGAGDAPIGSLSDKPAAQLVHGSVAMAGIIQVKLGGTVAIGGLIMPNSSGLGVAHSGTVPSAGIALIAGVTGDVIPVLRMYGVGAGQSANYSILSLPIVLSKVTDADVLTEITPGFAGSIEKVWFAVTDPATTAAKLTTLNLEIGSTNLTGGAIALTSANCTPLGNVIAGSTITAANVFTDSDTISVEATSTTAFVEGQGVLHIVLKSS